MSGLVLLTGATGAFGRCIARELLERGCELVLLVRGSSEIEATCRVLAALDTRDASRSVTVLHGDISLPGLGLEPRAANVLRSTLDGIVHAAATTAFGSPLADARRVNVGGTCNVLDFAQTVDGLRSVGYVSTTFVAGRRVGTIAESELVHGEGFVTTYEQSKYEAELLVRAAAEAIPLTIFRPSVIVGGETAGKPSALFFVLSMIRRGLLPILPAGRHTRLDLIDARDAAAAFATLLGGADGGGTYHLASGTEAPLVSEVVRAAGAPQVRFVDEDAFAGELRWLRRAEPRAATLYERLAKFIGILAYPKIFDTSAAAAALNGPVRHADPLAGIRAAFAPDEQESAA